MAPTDDASAPVTIRNPAKPIPPSAATASRYPSVMLDRLVSLMRANADLQSHVILTLDGRLDEERLAHALRLAVHAEPIYGCRWVEQWWRPYWEMRTDLDTAPLCSLQRVSAEALDAEVQKFMIAVDDPSVDPILHVRIFRGDQDTLCLKITHMVCDGSAMFDLMYLVTSLYNTLGRDPSYVPEPNLNTARGFDLVPRSMNLGERMRMVRRWWRDKQSWEKPAGWRVLPALPDAPRGAGSPGKTFVIRRVEPPVFRQIRRYAEQHSTSLNDVLVAANLRALHETLPHPEHPLRLWTTANLRRYLKEPAAPSNMSGRALVNVGTEAGGDFGALVRNVHQQMAALKSDAIGLGDWAVAPIFLNTMPHAWTGNLFRGAFSRRELPEKLLVPMISNAGSLDPGRLAFDGAPAVQAGVIGSMVYPPRLAIAISRFGETITYMSGFCESGFRRETVTGLLDRIMDCLARETAQPHGHTASTT